MSDTVSLSPQDFVAEGADRMCFRHPHRPDCCVKVLHPDRRSDRFWREIKYYSRLRQRAVDFRHLARFHGTVHTNLGPGAVFELIVDDDGRVSKSLEHYLGLNERHFNDWAVGEIENLKRNLYEQWIVFDDLNPNNILVKRLGFDEFRLVVIDDVGHNHFIPFASYSPRFARKKIVSAWNLSYSQWYSAYPAVLCRLKPYLVI